MVRAAGGTPNAVYVNPVDLTALQLATGADDRPLIGTTEGGMAATIAGLVIWPTPAVPAGTAVVAQADQIVVAVREDASVAVSEQFAFNADGTVVRVIARGTWASTTPMAWQSSRTRWPEKRASRTCGLEVADMQVFSASFNRFYRR